MKKRWMVLLLFLLVLSTAAVSAHEDEEQEEPFFQVDRGVTFLKATALILVLASLAVIPGRKALNDQGKKIIFWTIVAITMLSTLYFAGAIVYENVISQTEGPVHWHADYQVWACGERLDLKNPEGLSNKIGEPLFHEHDDDRIHVEGTVLHVEDVQLGDYFEVIGGELSSERLAYRTSGETREYEDGDTCNGEESTLKVYVNGERIEDPEHYLPYPDPYVPPGDCIIVEFGPGSSDTTDKICSTWQAKDWDYENYEEKREDKQMWGESWQ